MPPGGVLVLPPAFVRALQCSRVQCFEPSPSLRLRGPPTKKNSHNPSSEQLLVLKRSRVAEFRELAVTERIVASTSKGLMRTRAILLVLVLCSGAAGDNAEKTQKKELEDQGKNMTAE